MGRHRSVLTGVVVSVDDSKDERFAVGYEPADKSPEKPPADTKTAEKPPAKK